MRCFGTACRPPDLASITHPVKRGVCPFRDLCNKPLAPTQHPQTAVLTDIPENIVEKARILHVISQLFVRLNAEVHTLDANVAFEYATWAINRFEYITCFESCSNRGAHHP
eukprot:5396434-Amphidinium_carterae.1